MFIVIIKTIFAFIMLMLIGTNLLGMIVRTFIIIISFEKTKNSGIDKMIQESKNSGVVFLIFSIALTIGYFYALNHYYNYYLMIAGIMLMISRFPDLITEIKTGKKISKQNMPNRTIDIFFNVICWGALPVIWYSLNL